MSDKLTNKFAFMGPETHFERSRTYIDQSLSHQGYLYFFLAKYSWICYILFSYIFFFEKVYLNTVYKKFTL